MLDDFLTNAKKGINDLAASVSGGVGAKTMAVIEDWLEIFPQLAAYGLEITSFSMSLALSPSLNVELLGRHGDWSEAAISQRIKDHQGEKAITMVLTTIRTAYRLQRQTKAPLRPPLLLKIIVRITPEVRVVLGEPLLED